MPIALIIVGVFLLALSDWLQPDQLRKPTLNIVLVSLGGILWLAGIVLGFVNYKILYAILLLLGSFALGAILGIRKNQ